MAHGSDLMVNELLCHQAFDTYQGRCIFLICTPSPVPLGPLISLILRELNKNTSWTNAYIIVIGFMVGADVGKGTKSRNVNIKRILNEGGRKSRGIGE